ncbi:hypothetical protein WK25_20495 [Burkholderia latens]|nr:hypothetical protein WK25_20495 [Burkholderia latens]
MTFCPSLEGRRSWTAYFAVDVDGVKVGALPTSFNYLAACLAGGVTYVGVVKSSADKPVPTVEADFVPQ